MIVKIVNLLTASEEIKAQQVGDGYVLMHFPEEDTAMASIYIVRKDDDIEVTVDKEEKEPLYIRASVGEDIEVDNVVSIQDIYNIARNDAIEAYQALVEGGK